jgi:hypothetical protein
MQHFFGWYLNYRSLAPVEVLQFDGVQPLILQVLGLKKYHDEDSRRDFFSLVLSDGNVLEKSDSDQEVN